MGSRSKIDLAYIAGFLDGDGSLMLQIKKRSDTKRGIRFMATICFYQDTRHENPLLWIRKLFGVGYISQRKDGITELRINGYRQVHNILSDLKPFIRFKKIQAEAMLKATTACLSSKPYRSLSDKELRSIANCALTIREANYKSHNKVKKMKLYHMLGLTP